MKKAEQEQENRKVSAYLFRFRNRALRAIDRKRLRYCKAMVIYLEDPVTTALTLWNTHGAPFNGARWANQNQTYWRYQNGIQKT